MSDSQRTHTPSVRTVTDIASEFHFHIPYRRLRFNWAECACGSLIEERYGAWRRMGRIKKWKIRRYLG